MKKFLCAFVSICIMVVLASCNGTTSAPTPEPAPDPTPVSTPAPESETSAFEGAPTIELKIAHPHPAGSATDKGYNLIATMVAELTEGTVTAQVFPSGSLVSSAEAVEALRNGTIDIAQLTVGDVATVVPAMSLIDVPGSYAQKPGDDDYLLVLGAAIRETMAPSGISVLYPHPAAPSWFFSNKLNPRSPEDLKGLTVRASGKYSGLAVETWGASPVTITLADLPTAMERNTVDVVISPGLGAFANGWYELQHYLTITDFNTAMALSAISQITLDKMTPAQQDALYKAAFDGMWLIGSETDKEMEEGMGVMLDYGNQIEELTVEENKVFKDSMKPLRDQVISEVGEAAAKLEDVLQNFR